MPVFAASDGACIAYDDEGAGRPVLLLHGLMANAGFFEPQRALADQFRLIRVDFRGHGRSSVDAAASVERLASDVAELAAQLSIEDAILVGWSLGASVLWRVLAEASEDRFAAAVVIDMTPRVRNDADWALGLSPDHCAARSRAMRDDFAAFATAAGGAIFADGDAPHPLAAWAGAEFGRSDASTVAAIWSSLVDADFRPVLPTIRQPSLIAHGAGSHLYGADTADHLVGALPDARGIVFAHSGHSPHLEEPELFNRTLRAFAVSIPPVRHSRATA
ncbi:alpha/beta fold hydrolase [Sphingosinicella sp. BN140058]|uniref:alpha/beta fold hydrolase n=1 Tax=Sphingosinicella sp. BN140058 TaxID=1892855 RepID=UPI001010460B|nr:alpha/beta hydrolase [Sphingosinicella sp. BN140058]QAY77449.1 alpha/beta hydrolase [Sphingosinicella sp. BN140058]